MIKAYTDDVARDYKDETWGNYSSSCNTNQFTDELRIELQLKPGMDFPMYYTIDGTEPTKDSPQYSEPFSLSQSAEVKVAVYIEKGGRERRFTRSKYFEKIKPEKE